MSSKYYETIMNSNVEHYENIYIFFSYFEFNIFISPDKRTSIFLKNLRCNNRPSKFSYLCYYLYNILLYDFYFNRIERINLVKSNLNFLDNQPYNFYNPSYLNLQSCDGSWTSHSILIDCQYSKRKPLRIDRSQQPAITHIPFDSLKTNKKDLSANYTRRV